MIAFPSLPRELSGYAQNFFPAFGKPVAFAHMKGAGDIPLISGAPPMVDGTIPKRFTLEQWRALARRAGFIVQRMAALREVSLSVRSIERLFHDSFSAPPSHYLAQWWAEDARDYIVTTGANNKQAAAKFNFWDEAHLCHVFKRVFNRTPQSFFQQRPEMEKTPRSAVA